MFSQNSFLSSFFLFRQICEVSARETERGLSGRAAYRPREVQAVPPDKKKLCYALEKEGLQLVELDLFDAAHHFLDAPHADVFLDHLLLLKLLVDSGEYEYCDQLYDRHSNADASLHSHDVKIYCTTTDYVEWDQYSEYHILPQQVDLGSGPAQKNQLVHHAGC